MEFTSCQKNAMANLIKWWESATKQYFVLAGYAGTGKSTIIESLVNELRSRVKGGAKKNTFAQASMEMYRDFVDDSMFIVRYCTFTGKAAQVLRSKGLPAVTIHSLIYSPQVNPQTDEVTFNLKSRTELGDVDLIVVDEASMVNETMREELLSFGIPIIFVGDPGQLGPIATEGSTSNIMDQADVFMTTITRQAEDSPIITLATLARTGKHIPLKIFSSEVAVFPSSKMSPAGLLKADQILCGRNETRKMINERCRESLGFNSRFPQPGDKLICTKNNFDIGHINGLIGVCNEITVPDDFLFSGEMKLSFSAPDDNIHTNTTAFAGNFYEAAGEERFKFSKKGLRDMEFFEFGYAITVHKCVTTDTLINTSRGVIPISELDNGAIEGEFKEITDDILVHTGLKFEKPIAFFNNGIDDVFEMTTEKGIKLKMTSDHKIFIYNEELGKIQAILAKNLKPGQVVMTPKDTEFNGNIDTHKTSVKVNPLHNENINSFMNCDRVKSIEPIGKHPTVCLKMPSGSFTQNGIFAGNSQGSSYTYPVVIEEPLGTFDDRKRWMYTAITRASQKLIILRGNPGDIWKNK